MSEIEVCGVCKSFKKTQALKDISFSVEKGEIFGLIGPDGAGKTSLFRILTTLSVPDSGSAKVGGLDIAADYAEIRAQIGYMPGHFALYQDLSVEENLKFYATVFGTDIASNYDNIKDIYCQLEPFKDRKAGALSGGMKQKLALCCALVHRPRVLFLDEPTTGVDAVSRKEFWEILSRIRKSGVSIMVSTPYMDEAARCDRIALISEGHIIGEGTPQEIRDSYPETLYEVFSDEIFPVLKFLKNASGILSCYSFGSCCHASVSPDGPDAARIASMLEKAGFKNCTVKKIEAGIEDCFMRLS